MQHQFIALLFVVTFDEKEKFRDAYVHARNFEKRQKIVDRNIGGEVNNRAK